VTEQQSRRPSPDCSFRREGAACPASRCVAGFGWQRSSDRTIASTSAPAPSLLSLRRLSSRPRSSPICPPAHDRIRPNSAVRLPRTAPPARRSHSRRAIVPTRLGPVMPMRRGARSAGHRGWTKDRASSDAARLAGPDDRSVAVAIVGSATGRGRERSGNWCASGHVATSGGRQGGAETRVCATLRGSDSEGNQRARPSLNVPFPRKPPDLLMAESPPTGGLSALTGARWRLLRRAGPSRARQARGVAAEGGGSGQDVVQRRREPVA
jgi:hypothetical protein